MTHTIINPDGLFDPTPFGFSQAVKAGATLYVAGQSGHRADMSLADGYAAQVDLAFANLAAVLRAAGAEPRHVVKLTTYIVDHDMTKLGAPAAAIGALFGAALPAQTLVPVPRLALDGMMFEVEAVAVLD